MIEIAIHTATQRKYAIFPLHSVNPSQKLCSCGDPNCENQGKHPRTQHGLDDATTLPDQIREWWERWNNANIGIPCGKNYIAVLDIDPRHGGDKSLAKLQERHGKLPDTFTVKTGGDGLHYYFSRFAGEKLKSVSNALGTEYPGIDLKSDGGYVVGPGSLHLSGNRYEIINDVPLVDIPEWLEKLLINQGKNENGYKEPFKLPDVIPKGDRNKTLVSFASSLRSKGADEGEILAALQAVNRRCTPAYSEKELQTIAVNRAKKEISPSVPQKGDTKEKKGEDIPIPRAWIIDKNGINLTVLDRYNKKWFAYLHEGEIKFSEILPTNARIIPRSLPWKDGAPIPIVGIPQREAIEDAKDLTIEEIEILVNDHLFKYCDQKTTDKELCLYYIFFTWYYPKVNTVPYLRLRADTGKGKTRIQKAVGDLTFYPITAEGASSPSGIMRFAEKWHGTLVMDEMDIKTSPKESESGGYQMDLIKYLNLGFERGKYYLKSDKADLKKQEIFDPFCPKIISMRGIFQDVATEGRILSISTYETTRSDIPPTLHQDYYENVIILRGIIARYVLKNWSRIDGLKYPDLTSLKVEARLKQLTEPIGVIISQLFPAGLGKITGYILTRQNEIRKDRSESWEGSLFNVVYSQAMDEENPGYVTPQSVAQIVGTKATVITRTLKNIGFETIERRREVPIYENKMGVRVETGSKKKTIRSLIIPNEKIWKEISSRYYYFEPQKEGQTTLSKVEGKHCPDALKGPRYQEILEPDITTHATHTTLPDHRASEEKGTVPHLPHIGRIEEEVLPLKENDSALCKGSVANVVRVVLPNENGALHHDQ